MVLVRMRVSMFKCMQPLLLMMLKSFGVEIQRLSHSHICFIDLLGWGMYPYSFIVGFFGRLGSQTRVLAVFERGMVHIELLEAEANVRLCVLSSRITHIGYIEILHVFTCVGIRKNLSRRKNIRQPQELVN